MRVLAIFLAIAATTPALAADVVPPPQVHFYSEADNSEVPNPAPTCRNTSYVVAKTGVFKGQRLQPRKLTELPPGTTYMAVFRHIGGCEAPLTMVEYRNPRRR
jgi:hypothetical protein